MSRKQDLRRCENELQEILDGLWLSNARSRCKECIALLRAFAVARPYDFSFVSKDDIFDVRGSAFSGINEWDIFIEHFANCTEHVGRRTKLL